MSGLYYEQFDIGRTAVSALRESRSRPNAGIVTFLHEGLNQRDELVCECLRQVLMLRRPTH
jgi:acyl dehydratase